MVYETLYLFFTLGEKIFCEEVLAQKNERGVYTIYSKEGSAFSFFKFDAPTEDTIGVVPMEPLQLVRYYPMFSKTKDFDYYLRSMKETKRDEIDYYKYKIEVLEEHILQDYEFECVSPAEQIENI